MKTTRNWISYYVYSDNLDAILTERVGPFVKELAREQLVGKFFFIRYSDETGLHIRLRLLPDDPAQRQKLMRRANARLSGAKFVAYAPETERYGGPRGVLIAEDLFEASSWAVLRLMTDDKAWDYNRALASALQLHIGMFRAFGLTRQEAAALCAHLVQSAQNVQIAGVSAAELAKNFAPQRQKVVPHLSRVWDACEKGVAFKETWFRDWQKAMSNVGNHMHRAHAEAQLTLGESPQHDSPLWFLYESYIHMSNNRLGIRRMDEPFLAYILHQSLKSVPDTERA